MVNLPLSRRSNLCNGWSRDNPKSSESSEIAQRSATMTGRQKETPLHECFHRTKLGRVLAGAKGAASGVDTLGNGDETVRTGEHPYLSSALFS